MNVRREFGREPRKQIIRRATRDGNQYCESCGVLTKPGEWEIHHKEQDALQVDKSEKLTAEDGLLLCKSVCHPRETAKQRPILNEAKRREAAHLGARRPKQKMKSSAKLLGPERAHEKRAPVAALSGIWRQVIGEAE